MSILELPALRTMLEVADTTIFEPISLVIDAMEVNVVPDVDMNAKDVIP
jgi:hypothetical protein